MVQSDRSDFPYLLEWVKEIVYLLEHDYEVELPKREIYPIPKKEGFVF